MSSNSSAEDSCLGERHWYNFLASSLVTFGVGLIIIVFYRFALFLCCRNRKRTSVVKVSNQSGPLPNPGGHKGSITGAAGIPSFMKSPDPEIGWMTEAKDWAGELISGQTTTGRILVSSDHQG